MKQTKQFLRPLLMAIVMLVGMLVPKGAWAQSSPVTVGDEGFSTIQDAIDHIVYGEGFNATLTLHQDFTLGDVESITIDFYYFTEYFNFTIDLNGHTITGGCEWSTNTIEFYNHGEGLPTVTIANSCQDKKGKLFNCSLALNPNTKVIVKEGVSIYPSSELLDTDFFVISINSKTSSVENYGDIYGGVMNVSGGSFINEGRVAYVNGEFVNNGSYCAYFNWADDGSSFSALVYGGIYDYNEGDEFASITSVVTKEPTCTEPGVRTVTGTFEGFTDTKEVEIPACHDYQVQNVVWSEDYTTATLQLVCSRDEEHTANVEVTDEGITSEDTTPATCTTAGVRTYTATATYEGEEYTGTKEVEIPATGHSFTNKTLTEEPDEDSHLYAYVCDREGCEGHSDYNVVKGDGDGNNIVLTATTVGETTTYTATDVTIEDGKAFSTPVAFTVPSDQVSVARTFTASKPATVMLPFSIDASLVQGATFSEFGGVSYDAEKAQWVATMTQVETTLQAYKPYIVMLDEGNVSGKVTFDNKSVDVATFAVTPAASTMQTADANGWTFKAVNAAKTWGTDDPEIGKAYGFAGTDKEYDGYSVAKGEFVKIAAGASAKPGRCYLMKNDGEPLTRATEELPATIKVRFIVGSATGIGTLDTETGEMTLEGWYDLNGNKIEQPTKGGIYINNNKKVMVK